MPRRSSLQREARGYRERQTDFRELKQRFLIVCEGAKTEPNYFRRLRQDQRLNAEVKVLGEGVDPSQLIEIARAEWQNADFDQVWCVFDRDMWPVQNFNNACAQAKRHAIQIAYSNEAFELWYLLHFHYYDTAISRQQYIQNLEILLGHAYGKNSLTMYDELRSRQEVALRNAHTLLAQYIPPDPANDNPSTTVHLLIEELFRFAQ